MQRKINFNAGPATLPHSVLLQVADAVREYNNTGVSILELPHRGKEFKDIVEESTALVRDLCGLDDNYDIMWLQGGGRMQFSMIPMNFLPMGRSAGFIDSGHWANEAEEYAAFYGDAIKLASSEQDKYRRLPDWPSEIPDDLTYLHLCTNNTICGTQWHNIPETATKVPLIADMSSDIFSAEHDYTRYAMFYAAAQKNLGIAGIALAVVRKDMYARMARVLPPMLNYRVQAQEKSILNTANVTAIYTSLLMLRWIKEQGITNIERANRQKADMLYHALDNSTVFRPHVTEATHRSLMNVCFSADTKENEAAFLTLCNEHDITGVEGHRSVGGFRVSLYNAITVGDVEKLVELIKKTAS